MTTPLKSHQHLSLLLVLGLFLAASRTPLVIAADPESSVSPARVQTALAELEDLAKRTLTDTGVPGIAIAVVRGDEVLFKQGFGVREAGKPEPIDADTRFQMASVSKPISSTVMAVLVGEGKIDWNDRVTDHDPAFEMYTPYVTRELRLRDLLCHRSGLPDHAGDLLEDLGYDKSEVLRRLRYLPPDSSFRAGYAYTNTGYSEACYAAANAFGTEWSELAREKLFKPLGMTSTSYRFADYESAANRARLHVKVDGKWTAKNTRRPDAQAPAGGVSTTLTDIVQWLQLQVGEGGFHGKQVVAAAALAETHTPQFVFGLDSATGRLSSYGLGWIVSVERGGRVFYKHSGEFALGMRTEVAILPSEKLAIAVMSNAAPSGIPEALTESFFDLVLDGRLDRDWLAFASEKVAEQEAADRAKETDYSRPPEKPGSPLALTAYCGKYANEFFGELELAEREGSLVLRAGPKPEEFPLLHWDRDVFIYQPVGEMAGGLSGVRFTIGPGEKAGRVLIENLNVHGQGTFERTGKAKSQTSAAHDAGLANCGSARLLETTHGFTDGQDALRWQQLHVLQRSAEARGRAGRGPRCHD
jgi:CubicO group peptidase (beta-lactamase class C family)